MEWPFDLQSEEAAAARRQWQESLRIGRAGYENWPGFLVESLQEIDLTGLPPADDPYWPDVARWFWLDLTISTIRNINDLGGLDISIPFEHQPGAWVAIIATMGALCRQDHANDDAINATATLALAIAHGAIPASDWTVFTRLIPPRPPGPPGGPSLDDILLARDELRAALLHPMIDALNEAAKVAAETAARAIKAPRQQRLLPFNPDMITFTSDVQVQTLMRSLWAAENETDWHKPTDGPRRFEDPKQDVTIYIRERELEEVVWRTVLQLGDEMASSFLICMGKWFAGTQGDGEHIASTRVHVNDILSFRGVKRHQKGGYRRDQKEEVRRGVLALSDIWIRSNEEIYEPTGRGGKRRKRVSVDSRLLEIAVESEHELFGTEVPYAFRVRPGDWIAPYLGEDNRQTAILLKPVMEYDPGKGVGRMAMRLGMYLAPQWRIRSSHENYEQPFSVRGLFEATYLPLTPDHRLRKRTRDYFEEALDRLKDDGVLGSWEYVTGNEDELAPRNWWGTWLDWKVSILPSAVTVEHYKNIAVHRRRAVARTRSRAAPKLSTPHPL